MFIVSSWAVCAEAAAEEAAVTYLDADGKEQTLTLASLAQSTAEFTQLCNGRTLVPAYKVTFDPNGTDDVIVTAKFYAAGECGGSNCWEYNNDTTTLTIRDGEYNGRKYT